jgi:hypothetical protein
MHHQFAGGAVHGISSVVRFLKPGDVKPWFSNLMPREWAAILLAGSVFTYNSCANATQANAIRQNANKIAFIKIRFKKALKLLNDMFYQMRPVFRGFTQVLFRYRIWREALIYNG